MSFTSPPAPTSTGWTRLVAAARDFGQSRRTQTVLFWLSRGLLLAVISGYLGVWLSGNWEMLTEPGLQNSDARTVVFPFHRYDRDPALVDDPIASEMLALVPLGVQLLYRVLVPLTDVFVAPKIVQAIALLILLYAAFVLARSKRLGVSAACLLLFLILHDWFAIYRLAGGLPRAFGFPLFALWLAGALAHRPWVRRAAPVLCALTYPSVMNLLLAAEGLYALRHGMRLGPGITLRRLKRYGMLVSVCFLCALPAVMSGDDRGPIHTLEQAKLEPAFGKDGRLWILPFDDPTEAMGDAFVDTLKPKGASPIPRLKTAYEQDGEMYALVVFALVSLLVIVGVSPPPLLAVGFLSGATILYALSRAFAFRLYSPERYHSFGMRMAALSLLAVVLIQSFSHLRGRWRSTLKNLTASGFILLVWSTAGSGVIVRNGMTIDQRHDAPLYEFIAQLPKDVRFASHPMDGDGIPYYSARATMGAFETLQPWFTGSWQRQRERTEATLRAIYGEGRDEILTYARERKVTHFLINKRRYGRNLARGAGSFQPFSNYARDLLKGKRSQDLFFNRPPKSAVLYEYGPWVVIDVAKL